MLKKIFLALGWVVSAIVAIFAMALIVAAVLDIATHNWKALLTFLVSLSVCNLCLENVKFCAEELRGRK
jgi:hypothetical protein